MFLTSFIIILSLILFALVIVIDLVIEIIVEIVDDANDNINISIPDEFGFINKYITYKENWGISSANVLNVAA